MEEPYKKERGKKTLALQQTGASKFMTQLKINAYMCEEAPFLLQCTADCECTEGDSHMKMAKELDTNKR